MSDKPVSLTDFAQSHRITRGGPPWITTIPEWDEIRTAWKSGVGLATIKAWLATRGYAPEDLTPGRLASIRNVSRD